jgi:hypothetical protein
LFDIDVIALRLLVCYLCFLVNDSASGILQDLGVQTSLRVVKRGEEGGVGVGGDEACGVCKMRRRSRY